MHTLPRDRLLGHSLCSEISDGDFDFVFNIGFTEMMIPI
jgi:hypothetical protein